MYLKVFLIVGLLIFAQQAPKFIRKIFGIKDGDEGNFLGSIASGISGFGSGLISGAISGQGLKGAISGGIQGASIGYQNALAKGNSSIRSASMTDVNARRETRDNSRNGILASLQNMANSSKLRAESSKANYSDSSVESARTMWQQAQNLAVEAEGKYRDLIASGPNEGESTQEYNTRRTKVYNDWQSKASSARDAETNYHNVQANRNKSSSGGSSRVHRARKKIAAETGDNVNKNMADNVSSGASSSSSTIESRRNERTSNQNNG